MLRAQRRNSYQVQTTRPGSVAGTSGGKKTPRNWSRRSKKNRGDEGPTEARYCKGEAEPDRAVSHKEKERPQQGTKNRTTRLKSRKKRDNTEVGVMRAGEIRGERLEIGTETKVELKRNTPRPRLRLVGKKFIGGDTEEQETRGLNGNLPVHSTISIMEGYKLGVRTPRTFGRMGWPAKASQEGLGPHQKKTM